MSTSGGNNNVKPIMIPITGEPPILLKIDQQIVTGMYQKTAWAGIHKNSFNSFAKTEILTNKVPGPLQLASKIFRNPKIKPSATNAGIKGIKISEKCCNKRWYHFVFLFEEEFACYVLKFSDLDFKYFWNSRK